MDHTEVPVKVITERTFLSKMLDWIVYPFVDKEDLKEETVSQIHEHSRAEFIIMFFSYIYQSSSTISSTLINYFKDMATFSKILLFISLWIFAFFLIFMHYFNKSHFGNCTTCVNTSSRPFSKWRNGLLILFVCCVVVSLPWEFIRLYQYHAAKKAAIMNAVLSFFPIFRLINAFCTFC